MSGKSGNRFSNSTSKNEPGAPAALQAVPLGRATGRAVASIRLDASVLDHLFPLAELDLDEFLQLPGRTGERLEACRTQLQLDLVAIDDFAEFGAEQVDDRTGRAGGREHAGPGVHVK